MRQVVLAGTDLAVSRFVFGTSTLHHLDGATAVDRLLDTAAERGITHFDTSPYYGLGLGECLLGRLLKRRPELTVTTKVGLYPRFGCATSWSGMLVRKGAGKLVPPLARPAVDWNVERARRSLDESLKRLGRDCIDLLMLHEPDPQLVATDEWQRWIETERARVRFAGLAGAPARLLPFLKRIDPLTAVLQTRDSIEEREADVLRIIGREPQLAYGYLSRGGEAEPRLRAALYRQAGGAVLVSTRRADRLVLFARLGES